MAEVLTIGLNTKVYVDTNAANVTALSPAAATWTLLPAQRDGGFSRQRQLVDATNKSNAGWRSQVGVGKEADVSCSGVLVESDVALDHLETLMNDTDPNIRVLFKVVEEKRNKMHIFPGFFNLDYQAPNGEVATYDLSITVDGAPTQSAIS